MRSRFVKLALVAGSGLAALGLLEAGYAMGQSRFAQPKTVIHVVSVQWKRDVSDTDKEKVFRGVKKMAGSIPGIKNIWIKSERVEPRGFDDAFVIEFQNRAAADAYASSPVHKAWNDNYLALRVASVSIDVTNP
jgi:Stress responsive A/B Barrel Domain